MEILTIDDTTYEIKYKYEKSSGISIDQLIKFRQNAKYDTLIQSDIFYFICNEIKNANFEDIKNTTDIKVTE